MKDIDRYRAWREKTIEYLGGACTVCSTQVALEFDHIDESTKAFSISSNWGMADREALQQEIDKCQLLCKKHHRQKTVSFLSELQRGITHGSTYAWMKAHCTCDVCEAAKRERYDARNAKRRSSESPRGQYKQRGSHGRSKYSQGCRCEICKNDHAKAAREQRSK